MLISIPCDVKSCAELGSHISSTDLPALRWDRRSAHDQLPTPRSISQRNVLHVQSNHIKIMSQSLESHWIPGYGISRPVLQSNICYYLGPEAFVRPYVHQVRSMVPGGRARLTALQGRDGFLIHAPGGRTLTKVSRGSGKHGLREDGTDRYPKLQLEDICQKSKEWEKRATASMSGTMDDECINRPVFINNREKGRK